MGQKTNSPPHMHRQGSEANAFLSAPGGELAPAHRLNVGYKMTRPWSSREYAVTSGVPPAQRLPQSLQTVAFPGTVDIDMESACFVLCDRLVALLGIPHDITAAFQPELQLLKDLGSKRDQLTSNELCLPRHLGEEMLQEAVHGKRPSSMGTY